jgi:lauroyl/myristoyl acyltransferase
MLERDKGVYFCLSHNGSHHVLTLLTALQGYRVAGVRDRNEGALRRYVQDRYEETFPEFRAIRMFYADTFPRDIYRAFQEGFILGSALDVGRDRGSHLRTATVSMFGQQREFLSGPMHIALRCGAPILQGFVVSRRNFYFRLIVQGPLIDSERAKDDPNAVQETMQCYADNVAEHIRQHPCHLSKT